jgi:lysophospholipase L1-like esterase
MLTSYRAQAARQFEKLYPKAHFSFFDAAIGGTDAHLGVFRLDRDVLARSPDLVFLDFSANDDIYTEKPDTMAAYESIIRRLIVDGHVPVVQVIFPFKWNVQNADTQAMKHRTADYRLAEAYRTGVGDAIQLAIDRTRGTDGKADLDKLKELWPLDGVHPGDSGYALFAEAAMTALQKSIEQDVTCMAPPQMLYADTYMQQARVRLSSLAPLPQGWRIGMADRTAANFDWLMSRWLDDEVIASNADPGPGGATKPVVATPEPLKLRFNGSTLLLFGESTMTSCNFQVSIDGKIVEHLEGKVTSNTFDGGKLAKRSKGNAHLVQLVATGLAPVDHTMQITLLPDGKEPQELRLESICVAGGKATVTREP